MEAMTQLPDWMAALRDATEKTSNADVGRRIGYSRTAISLVLAGKYPGDTTKIATAVMKNLVGAVNCPGLAEVISIDACREWSTRTFSATNSQRVRMRQACQVCPNRTKGETHDQ